MNISIEVHIYDKKRLLKGLQEWGADDENLTLRILEKCGSFFGDTYVLLNNEFQEGFNPYYNVSTLFDAAFKKFEDDSFHVFLYNGYEGINAVELNSVAKELNIEIPEDY